MARYNDLLSAERPIDKARKVRLGIGNAKGGHESLQIHDHSYGHFLSLVEPVSRSDSAGGGSRQIPPTPACADRDEPLLDLAILSL